MTALPTAPLVLVVDDEPETCALVVEVLDELGLQALVIGDPEAVLELAATHQPALILLDIMMRGVDGYTLATRLRGDPTTPAIRRRRIEFNRRLERTDPPRPATGSSRPSAGRSRPLLLSTVDS